MTEEQEKSLETWLTEIRTMGKRHWLVFYKELMGKMVPYPSRLYKAVNLYGEMIVFEAIVDSSNQTLTGDGLSYVIKVASNKWKAEQQQKDEDATYIEDINRAKEATTAKNESLARKLKGK